MRQTEIHAIRRYGSVAIKPYRPRYYTPQHKSRNHKWFGPHRVCLRSCETCMHVKVAHILVRTDLIKI